MFDLWCPTCRTTYLVGPRRIVSLRNTSGGPVASVRCPEDHVNVVAFSGRAQGEVAEPQPESAA